MHSVASFVLGFVVLVTFAAVVVRKLGAAATINEPLAPINKPLSPLKKNKPLANVNALIYQKGLVSARRSHYRVRP